MKGNGAPPPSRPPSPRRSAHPRPSGRSCAVSSTGTQTARPRGQVTQVTPVTGQASHQLASLARANALVIVPEDVTELDAGAVVDVLELPG